MQPKSVSASSLDNWFSCQELYASSNLDKVPEFGQKLKADVGTACHYALEHFVLLVLIKKTHSWDDLALLLRLYEEGFLKLFGHASKKDDDFKDGLALIKKWHKRTDLSGWTILSVEQMRQIPIADTGVLLTYIFDRIQTRTDPDTGLVILEVVDYKSINRNYSPSELEKHLQMRIYGLAAAIQAKMEGLHYDELWVTLDLLRHEPVGIEITREQNEETWLELLQVVELIKATQREKARRTLGPKCKYCPVSASCKELTRHIDAGGILSMDIDEMVKTYFELDSQIGAAEGLKEKLGLMIQDHAQRIEKTRFIAGEHPVVISTGSRRGISDASRAAGIIGPELMKMLGKLNIGDVEKLLESDQITEDQKKELRKLIVRNPTRQSLKIQPVPAIGGKK